ncbi:MAG: LTA synthase family protein [bacterium]|nr:LTA synthase family protein [bacterium]
MIDTLKKVLKKIKNYLNTNILMSTFIITSLISGFLVRLFTVGNIFAIKPILADLFMLLVITAFGYFIKPKNQFKYFLVWSIILTFICISNTMYYSNYISFASISLLKTATELGGYTDALLENVLEIKDFIFLFQIFTLTFVHIQLKKKKYYDKVKQIEKGKIRFLNMSVVALVVLGFFISMLTSTDISRLNKQWNRSSIVMEFGIYIYQVNDVISSVRTTVNEMFGYDESYKTFRQYYEAKEETDNQNEYSNIFEGKNVLVIHGESLQGFTMNLKFNGEELTPNLNRLSKEGIYFSNFYSQESVGNSSDSEFTSLTSILPSSSGTVFMNYFDRNYETILKLLKEKDYYTFSMHGNNGSAWNRNVMYKYLGYDDFYYYTKDYEIDEEIGLGLSDKSFFRQSVEKIKDINNNHKNWYGTLVMLTNHTPFNDTDSFDYLVDYKTTVKDEEGNDVEITEPWLEETRIGNYLKSVHYADEAIGKLMTMLDEAGLLDNTIVVLYGDHDCKLKPTEFKKLYESEYYNDVLIDPNNTVGVIDEFTYEINRKVPFFIWSKDVVGTSKNKTIDNVMGMIDIMPTLSNMLGVKPKYALGNDMFNIDENVVVFPNGNWITNKLYYNSSKETFRQLDLDDSIDIDYVNKYNTYSDELINISNGIITYDLIKAYETGVETLIQEN